MDTQEAILYESVIQKPSNTFQETDRSTRTGKNNQINYDPIRLKIDIKGLDRSFGLFQKIDKAIAGEILIDFNDRNSQSKTIKEEIFDKTEPV